MQKLINQIKMMIGSPFDPRNKGSKLKSMSKSNTNVAHD